MANPKTQVQVLHKGKCYLRHGTLDAFNCRFVKWRFTENIKKLYEADLKGPSCPVPEG